MTLIVGITGGIASGKSTFSKEVVRRNLKILDSDKQVSTIYKKPKKEFLLFLQKIGLGASVKNKKINKKIISEIIFSNNKIKTKLERYIFRKIRKQRYAFIKKERKLKTKNIFLDIPLLFENNLNNQCDIIISIISTKKNRLKRIKRSKKISEKMFKKILKSQTSDLTRKKNSDIIIYNNDSISSYKIKINKTLNKLIL